MLIYPAIDLYAGQAVRLYRGDYAQMTVYSPDPVAVARDFAACGAEQMHIVDLEGARDGATPNLKTVLAVKKSTGLFCEVGGGIRSLETAARYLEAGVDRVILGTAAVTDPDFLREAVSRWPGHVAAGVDLKDGLVAIRGWRETAALTAFDFCARLRDAGVDTLICTDISRDGAMQGTNHGLYQELTRRFDMRVIASGGVSSLKDVRRLKENGLYGAIIGKAYYTGAIDLKEAVEAAK